MVGSETDRAPAHVEFVLISLANKEHEIADEKDSPKWRCIDFQASSRGFSPGRKAPWRK